MEGILLLAFLIGVPLGLAIIGIKVFKPSPERQVKRDADALEVNVLRGQRGARAVNELYRRYGQ
ncbi:hypothetical protein [Mycolicibacterium neoaurum]|uniref:hypothetical protein n=1 Tax=Mycolicibacterium neoaurum TaxID=1795 RepID=UPI001F4C968E|nr:hypothetical protein [Mycolicibacterium neoaurum]